jgi:carbonic anhydrase/acetyltransferase-like protein (isoleucine patch superfamily)
MLVKHLGCTPRIHSSVLVAPGAVVCGNVTIGEGSRILHGAVVVAEGGSLTIGRDCVVMHNAVVRSTPNYSTRIGDHCLIGPNAHVVGCSLDESVFIATGAAVFHGARLGARSEVRINGVVHLKSLLAPDATVPIGWVAVGDPARILPPGEHDRIWSIQEPLNFPNSVYGIERPQEGQTIMPQVTRRLSDLYGGHADDEIISV